MYGNDHRYANNRLHGTQVTFKKDGSFVHIDHIDEDGICRVLMLDGSGKEHRVSIDELDLHPVSLGFVNHRGGVSYVCRVPKRGDYRQGLRRENSKSMIGGYPPWEAISKTVTNNFPSFNMAFSEAKKSGLSRAWCRHWAIGPQGELIYRYHGVVGSITENKEPALKNSFMYLKEYLNEALR